MFTDLFKRSKHDANEKLTLHLHSKEEAIKEQAIRNEMWYCLRTALRGDKEAQYRIGLSYLNGDLGLDRSFRHAEKWLDQAAHQGHIEAKQELEKAYDLLAFS